MRRTLRRVVSFLLLAMLVFAAVGVASARAGGDDFPPPPPDCAAVHKDYTDFSCLAQTRNGTFTLEPHIVRAGGVLTGRITNRCKKHDGVGFDQPPNVDCPVDWTGINFLGKILAGCKPTDSICKVRIPKHLPKTWGLNRWVIVTVGITSDQGTGISKDYWGTIGTGEFVLAGHVTDHGDPVPGVKVSIAGPKSKTRTTDKSGLYQAILPKGKYTVSAAHDDVRPVRTRDCVAEEKEKLCHVDLIQDRTADFEVSVPELTFRAKLGAVVHSPENHKLIRAGTPFLIDVTLRNNSRDKRLLVFPIYAQLGGNASDGHLQEEGLSVRKFTPDGSIDEVRPSPFLVLQPKQTRTFNVVVRTLASDAFAEGGDSPAGGTEALVKFTAPFVAAIRKGADIATLTKSDLTMLNPKQAVEMTEGSDSFKVGIDDSAPATPEFDYLTATWYITKGVVAGLWRATWGIVRGVFYDIPRLIAKAGWWALNQPFAMINYEVELWNSIKDDPAAVAAFLNPLTNATMLAAKEVPSLVDSATDLYAKLNEAAYQHFNKLEKEWYAGDWREALQEYTAEGTEQLANFALPAVAMKLAPGILARVPQAAAAFQQAKAALYAATTERLAPFVSKETTVSQAAAALSTVMKAAVGKTLSLEELEALYGMSAKEAEWLARFTKVQKLVITFRSRAQSSLEWIKKGAVLKPEWIKLKTVGLEDVKYLGYKEADIGRLVLKKPVSRAEFYNDVYPKIPVGERAQVAKRWFMRSQEWEVGDGPKMLKWAADGETPKTSFNWKDNLNNPEAAPLETPTSAGFKLDKTGRPVGEYLVEVKPEGASAWSSVTGDIDLLAITEANGAPLGTDKYIKVMNELRESPLGIQHPETATWNTAEAKYGGLREKYLSNGGACCAGQFGADGVARAVQYVPKLSKFKNSLDYLVFFRGGYIATR